MPNYAESGLLHGGQIFCRGLITKMTIPIYKQLLVERQITTLELSDQRIRSFNIVKKNQLTAWLKNS